MSSEFHHNEDGHHVVENGHKLVRVHGKIYKLNDGQLNAIFDDQHHVLNATIPIDFSITKNVASMLFGHIFILIFLGFLD
jgi:F-type H+-transporting ATPase subunit a